RHSSLTPRHPRDRWSSSAARSRSSRAGPPGLRRRKSWGWEERCRAAGTSSPEASCRARSCQRGRMRSKVGTPMPRRLTMASALMLLTLAAGCSQPADATSTAALLDPRLNGAYRFDRNGWIFVHLQGAPDVLGFQHGYLLAPEITDLL